jgi:hypothetical protein
MGELAAASMGEVGEDAIIIAVRVWSGAAVLMPTTRGCTVSRVTLAENTKTSPKVNNFNII